MRYQALGTAALAATMIAPPALAQSVPFTATGDANWTETNGVLMADNGGPGYVTFQHSHDRFELTFDLRAAPPPGENSGTTLIVGLDCPAGTEPVGTYSPTFVFNEPDPFLDELPGATSSDVAFRLTIEICTAASGPFRFRSNISGGGPGPWRWNQDAWYTFRMRVDDGRFWVELGGVCLICPNLTSPGPWTIRLTYHADSRILWDNVTRGVPPRVAVEHGVLHLRNINLVQ